MGDVDNTLTTLTTSSCSNPDTPPSPQLRLSNSELDEVDILTKEYSELSYQSLPEKNQLNKTDSEVSDQVVCLQKVNALLVQQIYL